MADRTKLPRQVWLLGGVSFFADVSGEMIYPLLPLFIVAVLGATATDMGWIEGLAQAVVAFTAAWAGARSDRFRKRLPWVRVGYGLPVLGKAILEVDLPLILGVTLVAGIAIAVANLLVDLVYLWLDPRLRD